MNKESVLSAIKQVAQADMLSEEERKAPTYPPKTVNRGGWSTFAVLVSGSARRYDSHRMRAISLSAMH